MFDEFAHLKITSEKLDWAAERMMGMQEDADERSERKLSNYLNKLVI